MTSVYFSGQGSVMIGKQQSSGFPGVLRRMGNVPGMSFTPKLDVFKHQESESGARSNDMNIILGREAEISIELEAWDRKNLALEFLGADAVVNAGTVTAEALPTVVVGDLVPLKHGRISTLVITDSAAETPATLVANTDYEIDDAIYGHILIKNIATYTQPFKAAYAYDESINIPLLTENLSTNWVRFAGLNTAASNAKLLVDYYKVQFETSKVLELIQDKGVAKRSLIGTVLIDTAKKNDTTLGQFGRIQLLEDAA